MSRNSLALAQTTVDRLPVEHLGRGRQGKRSGITAEDRAKMDAMRETLIATMQLDGVSRCWVSERTGVPLNHVSQYLAELGGRNNVGLWRLPNSARLKGADRR